MRFIFNPIRTVCLIIVFSICPDDLLAQLTWTAQSSGTSDNIESLDFVDANTGWTISGTDGTSRTINGGTNWTYSNIPGGNNMYGVDFVTTSKGWACDNFGTVFQSIDGGVSWSPQYTNWVHPPALELFFLDDQHGWIARQDQVLFTVNGGADWDSSLSPMTWPPYDVEFVDANVGYIMGLSLSIAKSTDGGNNWTNIPVYAGTELYGSFDVVNDSTIYVVGQNGVIFFSNNSGASWVQQTSGITGITLLDVHFFDLNHGIIVGAQGTILTTIDGGNNWIPNISGTAEDLRGVEMVSPTVAYTVGYGGTILKTVAQPTDLVIDIYLGDNTVCIGDNIDVPVTIKNLGSAEITSGTFVITNSIGVPVLIAPWTGSLLPSEFEDIVIGQIPISGPDYYTIIFTGDSLTTNNTYSFPITVYDHASVSVNGPHEICPGDSVELIVTGGEGYQWPTLSTNDTLASVYVSPLTATLYPVVITYHSVCTYTDTIFVIMGSGCGGYDNLAFSPNGDGLNDYLHIEGAEGVSNNVRIFNRWGEEIRYFENYNNEDIAWHGDEYNGAQCVEGTYFYVVQSATVIGSGFNLNKSGWIQIVR